MGSKKKASKGGATKPGSYAWTFGAVFVVLVSLAVYGVFVLQDVGDAPTGNPGSRGPSGPSTAELQAQLLQLHAGISGVAGRGDSGVFKKLQAMAGKLKDALARADAAPSEAERRAILEEGLASKVEMLTELTMSQTALKSEEAKDQKDNAPFLLDGKGHVAKLSRESFTTFIGRNPRSMVEFYAPWCPHCKKMAPDFEKCAEKFRGRAGFAAIDGTEEEQLSRVFSVKGYPTLKWFVRSRPFDYEGPRTEEHITKWVEERLKPAYADVDPSDDLGSALDASGANTSICAGLGQKDGPLFLAFEVAAETFRGKMLFVWSTAKDEKVTLHRRSRESENCGGGTAGACHGVEDVVKWIQALQDAEEAAEFDAGV